MFCWAFDLLLTTLILLGAHQLVASQSNSKGRAFMLAFLPNFNMTTNSSLLVTTDAATTVHIYIAATGNHTRYVISKDSSLHIKLPKEVTVFTNLKIAKNKAVFVYTSQPVSVYGISSQILSSSQAAFLAIPIEKWGQSYIVATYSTMKKRIAEIIILVAENTVFTIYLNSIGSNQCNTQHIDGRQSLSYIFEREDVFRISCVNDLTGSVIKGSHPFGVIAGDQCISNSKRIDSLKPCDQMMEMMIPSTMLGHSYIVSSLVNRRSKLRIVYNYLELKAADIPFNVSFTILSGSNATTSFKNVFFEEVVLEPGTVASVKVESHKSVMVILYSFGPVDSAAMTVVPPVERFDAEYNVFFNQHNFSDRATNCSYYVDVYMPIERMAYNLEGFEVSTINATNFGVLHAKNVNKSIALLSKKTFYSNSNIIVTVSDSLSSMAFLVGMKIDFFTGTDNCSRSPCQNDGYCYAFGNTLRCFCGDQLLGDFCETDIRNSCLSQPCLNGGNCRDEVFDFTCKCPRNFMGKICDSVITTVATTTASSIERTTSSIIQSSSSIEPTTSSTIQTISSTIQTSSTIPTPSSTETTTSSTIATTSSTIQTTSSTETTSSTIATTSSTIQTTSSTEPSTSSTIPTTSSIVPSTSSTIPTTSATITKTTSSTIPTTSSTIPTTSTTIPTTSSTIPTTSSTIPTTNSTIQTTSSTEPSTSSTEPSTSSTIPTISSTEPTTSSTEQSTSSTEQSTSFTIPSTSSTIPTISSTIPTTSSTIPATSSTISTASSTGPTTSYTIQTTSSTEPTTSSTIQTTSSTESTTSSTEPPHSSTEPPTRSTIQSNSSTIQTRSTKPMVNSTFAATSQPTPSTSKSGSTSKLSRTMKPHKSHERPVCNCTCDNKTVEEITKSKEEIEKELKVDPKTVHKTITKYTSTYDKRPSAAGIGILGIVFVSALFGSIVFLDLMSAVHYILSRCLWKGKKQLKQSKNTAATPFQTHDKLKASSLYKSSYVRKTSTYRDGIVLPRFIVDRNGSVVLDKKSSDFRFKRLLWSLKQEMASWEFDTIMDNEVHVDKSSFDLADIEKTDNIYDEVKLNNSEEIRNSSLGTDIDYKSYENDVCDLSQGGNLAGVDNSSINNMEEDNCKTQMSDDNDGICNYSKNIYFDCDSIEMNNFLQSMSPKDHIIMEKNIQP
ncbi:serine-rich adhesin for platelets-like isoform X1 [Biomphalaria pfeifferi]|uniref:Serine-rich adhesin for platelets-like isoform X1 n=1 Tax=Biomphalaria pfeifferi TaxID=112525 RepID=A0AAD8AUS9_BIOPF|nr:serine-rich adhesin for platelets-like isoform X1 [Biomphalaria pfeifferi]